MAYWLMIFVTAWAISGAIGGHLLSYPGDGLNARHFLGAMCGPVALGIAIWEQVAPD